MKELSIQVKEIIIYDDKFIELEIFSPASKEPQFKSFEEDLKELGFHYLHKRFPMGKDFGVARVQAETYPIERLISVRCQNGCSGMSATYNEEVKVEGRSLLPSTILKTEDWMRCNLTKNELMCVIPSIAVRPRVSQESVDDKSCFNISGNLCAKPLTNEDLSDL